MSVCVCVSQYKSGVTETQWRTGQALRPYYDDVTLLVKNKQVGMPVDVYMAASEREREGEMEYVCMSVCVCV